MIATRTSRAAAGLGAAVAILVAAGPSTAAPTVDPAFSNLSGKPRHLALGPDGNVWTPLSDSTKELAKIAPDGTVTEYDVDTLSGAEGITSDGTRMWVTRPGGVATFSPANPAGAVATPIAAITDPRAITLGADGNLWTGSGDKVVHFAPSNPAGFTAQTVAGMGARGIASGGDGALYVADFAGQRVVRITTAGAVSDVPLGGGPQEVAAGLGTQLAVANPGAIPQVVARVDGGALLGNVAMPTTDPFGIILGNDGAYWTARFASGDLGRIAPDGTVTSLPIGAGTGPRQITKGPGDTLFVGLESAMKVARVTGVAAPSPATPMPIPTPTPTPATALSISGLSVSRAGLVRLTVNAPTTVSVVVERRTIGRRVAGHCVAVKPANRARRHCVRFVRMRGGTQITAATAGTYSAQLPAKLRHGARYRVLASADGANVVSATFRAR